MTSDNLSVFVDFGFSKQCIWCTIWDFLQTCLVGNFIKMLVEGKPSTSINQKSSQIFVTIFDF